MIELPLIFAGGLLGSSHCIGMCGGFALWVGVGSNSAWSNLARQLIYSAGRIFTYAAIGAAVGYAGLRLVQLAPPVINVQAALAIAAGCLLVVQGLLSAGLLRLPAALSHAGACMPAKLIGPFLRGTGNFGYFLAGMFTGFLPCGLVYAYLALATASGGLLRGLLTMTAFGLGTIPLMAITGVGVSLLSGMARRRVFQLAAWCIVITGVVSLARGANLLRTPTDAGEPACPMCASAE